MKAIGDLRPLIVGDRLIMKGKHFVRSDREEISKYGYVVQVARVEDRGVVCDLMHFNNGNWFNMGHRCLYEWTAKYEELEKA